MYLTTHRIEAMKHPRDRAIHGYLYLHGESFKVTPEIFEEISTRDPGGTLVYRHNPEPPSVGGNAVLAYLDIVGPDEIEFDELSAQLDEFSKQLDGSQLPQMWTGLYWFRFHISKPIYRHEQKAIDEFEELKEEALEILVRYQDSVSGLTLL